MKMQDFKRLRWILSDNYTVINDGIMKGSFNSLVFVLFISHSSNKH